ncbi:MAG: PBP1A family penicillin-binding protein [Patescibacteria group bacterium]|nr:PBP1A family penicillin-binding protein [Patescibacteria group bacterium]
MPIPGLLVKTSSPQSWRNNHANKRRLPIMSGRPKKPKFKLPANTAKRALIALAILVAGGGIFSIILLAWIAKDLPNPNRIIDRSIALSTKIYDRTGETLLYDVHGNEKRTVVELAAIPEYVKQATLTAEDKNFYQHQGFSLTGILRSAIVDIIKGGKVQGGSTLTQQLVKNAILSPEKTFTRKIKEVIISYQIEKKFTKDEILKMYFNEIPYGSTAYGIGAAAQTYFGKNIKDVNLAEGAILAAIPRAPTYYSPYGPNKDDLLARQKFILNGMADAGFITKDQAKQASEETIKFQKSNDTIVAPHFVMYVKQYLTEKYGDLAVEQGGLKVITTLDMYKQNLAEQAINDFADKNEKTWQANNAAMVAIDPKTGQVLSMVGSRDFFNDDIDGQVNVAIRPRQPGSSFKPIVYATALNQGFTPQTVLYDVITNFKNYDGRDYTPRDYDLKERGPVTLAKALAGSLNIPAVKASYLAGIDNIINFANNLGYSTLTDRSRFGLSLVLGGAEVKLLEHVNAYATFAREGEWHAPAVILKVEDKDGNVLEEFQPEEKKVISTQVARQMNQMMSDNGARAYVFGASNYLNLGNRPVATKTGTTNDYHDAWTIGFTPSLAAGVWVGNTRNEPMKRGADGSVVAAPIWHEFMAKVLGDTPIENFTAPDPVQTDKPVLNGSIINGITVKINRLNGKLATNLTPNDLVEERTYRQVHNILFYINKTDPQGNTAPDLNDQQYQRWEDGVQAWAKANNIVSQDPPTEYDDGTTNPSQPTITFTSPADGETITNRQLTADVNTYSPTNIMRVQYYLNDELISSITTAPYRLNVNLTSPAIANGQAILKATIVDSSGATAATEINIKLQFSNDATKINWVSPTNNQTLRAKNFPLTIKGSVENNNDINQVEIYYSGTNNQATPINTVRQILNNQIVSQWQTPPAAGSYQIYLIITDKDGYSFKVNGPTVTVK